MCSMAIKDNNFTIAVGPAVSGERSFLLQTAGLVLYPFSLLPCNVDGRSNLDSLRAAVKGNRTMVVFPEIPRNSSFENLGGEPETFTWDNKKRCKTGVLVRVVQKDPAVAFDFEASMLYKFISAIRAHI